jgi:putative transposase
VTNRVTCGIVSVVKLTLQTQIFPDKEQARKLAATMEAFNAGADWLAGEAFKLQSANKVKLQHLYYTDLREKFSLSAQMAIRCIAQVCEAFSRDRTNRPTFRKYASIPYDQRMMSFKGADRVSLLTLEGRIIVPFVMGKYQAERFHLKYGQCDLVRRKDGKWFLLVTVDLPDSASIPATDFIGVDFGVVNLATDSTGETFSGQEVEKTRQKYQARRQRLQMAAAKRKQRGHRPKSIRRKLKSAGQKEQRFRRDTNHVISKKLVEKAKDTRSGIAVEDLKGIRDRARFRKTQRAQMSGWSFAQLRTFVEYKAGIAGVPTAAVDPRHTSQMCSCCGHIAKANRKSQSEFQCQRCGFALNADFNAALNIKARAAVNQLKVPENATGKAAQVQGQAPTRIAALGDLVAGG